MAKENGAQAALAALLSQIFTRSDLQRLARDYAPEFVQELTWSSIPFRSALDLIGVLVQSRRLNRDFFELLVRERPRHRRELAEVAARYGIGLSVPDIEPSRTAPRVLVCVHLERDAEAFARVATHTEPLVQGRWLTLHAARTVRELDDLLPGADMILALLSAELLQSEVGRELGYSLDMLSDHTLYLGARRACRSCRSLSLRTAPPSTPPRAHASRTRPSATTARSASSTSPTCTFAPGPTGPPGIRRPSSDGWSQTRSRSLTRDTRPISS
jgi:hypothetical protein